MSEDRDPAEGDFPSDTYDAGNEQHVAKRKRELAVTEARKSSHLGQMLADKIGRAAMWELLNLALIFTPQFAPTYDGAEFLRGQREHALNMLRYFLHKQPNLTAQMIAENDTFVTNG